MRDVYTASPICVALELPVKAKQGRKVSPRKALTTNHPREEASPAAKLEGTWGPKGCITCLGPLDSMKQHQRPGPSHSTQGCYQGQAP